MKRRKDISDLIRENQHKLNERPSPRAWQRLESKLDNQHSRQRTSVYKQFAMIAAVIALVAVASPITLTVNSTKNQSMMMAEADISPTAWPVQELETVYTDANEDLHKVVEFQRSLKRIYASNPTPITEGAQNKKVIAANESNHSNNTITKPQAKTNNAIAMNDSKTKNKGTKETVARASYDFPESVEEEVMESEAMAVYDETTLSADDVVSSATDSKIQNSVPTSSVSSKPAKIVAKKVKPNQNKWFLGTWKYYNYPENDELFHIKEINGKIQMTVQSNDSADVIYQFISKDDKSATFQFKDSDDKIIIKKVGTRALTTIYRNGSDYGIRIMR